MEPWILGGIIIALGIGGVKAVGAEKVTDKVTASLPWWSKYDAEIRAASRAWGVPFAIIKGILLNESTLGTEPSVARGITSPSDVAGSTSQDKKSWGIAQFTLATAKGLDATTTVEKLNDPAFSINLCAKYLAQLHRSFSTSWEYTVKAYNQGPGNMRAELAYRNLGRSGGYAAAAEYWRRFKRNYNSVLRRDGIPDTPFEEG